MSEKKKTMARILALVLAGVMVVSAVFALIMSLK